MTDLWSDKDLSCFCCTFTRHRSPLLACAMVVGLSSTKVADPDSPWCYKGYEMTLHAYSVSDTITDTT